MGNKTPKTQKIRIKPGVRLWIDNRLYEGGKIYEVTKDILARIGPTYYEPVKDEPEPLSEEPEKTEEAEKEVKKPPADKAVHGAENK